MNPNNPQTQESWLLHFPIMFFASIMGVGGLGLVTQKALKVFALENLMWLSTAFAFLSTFLLCLVTCLYFAKIIKYPSAFLGELRHPIRINFFAAISVSMLIISILNVHLFPQNITLSIFYGAVFLQLVFSLYVVRYWFINAMQQQMANPAWFIPIVGNLIVPLAGMNLNLAFENYIIPFEILVFYFGMGSFFWILLNAALLIRLIFGENLPQKFLPTLFIFIAPPSVFALDILLLFAHLSESGVLLGVASASFSVALFFVFLMISMLNVFVNMKFALSWWAFTFPLAAFTLCALELYRITRTEFYAFFSIFGGVATSVIVCFVGIATLLAVKHKKVCVIEE